MYAAAAVAAIHACISVCFAGLHHAVSVLYLVQIPYESPTLLLLLLLLLLLMMMMMMMLLLLWFIAATFTMNFYTNI